MAARDILRNNQNLLQFYQSDESEDENLSVRFAQLPDLNIQELLNEMDVTKYYKTMCAAADTNSSLRCARKTFKSKAVQTEPDMSGIPPSWILTGQNLISQLYDGLGNAINTVYHSPIDCSKEAKNTQDIGIKKSSNMKYFTLANGYWTSKLMPEIKIPAFGEQDRQMQILYSEDFKKQMKNLMQIAAKLRNLIPYLDGSLDFPTEMKECEVHSMENKSQETGEKLAKTQSVNDSNMPSSDKESWTDASETSDLVSVASVDDQPPEHIHESPKDVKYSDGETSSHSQESISVLKTKKEDAKLDSEQMPGVIVSKYKLEPQTHLCVKVTNSAVRTRLNVKVPRMDIKHPEAVGRNFITIREGYFQKNKQNFKSSSSIKCHTEVEKVNSVSYNKIRVKSKAEDRSDRNIQVMENESKYLSSTNQGKFHKQLKEVNLVNSPKNFIQRNILASRLQPNRAGLSNVISRLQANRAGPSNTTSRLQTNGAGPSDAKDQVETNGTQAVQKSKVARKRQFGGRVERK